MIVSTRSLAESPEFGPYAFALIADRIDTASPHQYGEGLRCKKAALKGVPEHHIPRYEVGFGI